MSTLALDGSEAGDGGRALRYADLVLLALAAPVFVLADFPLLGYAAAAVAWIVQHAILVFAQRRSAAALRAGNRRAAIGSIGAAVLGRVWLVTLAILLVGLLGEREDGLAAAVLAFILVTVHLGGQALAHAFGPQPKEPL